MEHQDLAKEPTHLQSSYSIITIPGSEIPQQYKPLILSKWMRSLRFGNDYFRLMDSDSYYKVYEQYINSVLNRPEAQVKLSVLSDDKDVVLGFSVIEKSILHYIHIHQDNRRIGIAKSLLPKELTTFTHLTKIGLIIWPTAKYKHLIFNPFA